MLGLYFNIKNLIMKQKETKWINAKRYECKINGHNKFWEIYVFDETIEEDSIKYYLYCFFTKYGKIGTFGKQSPIKRITTKFERDKEITKITNAKIFKGYSFIKDLIKLEDPFFSKLEVEKNEDNKILFFKLKEKEIIQENEDGFDFIDLK